MQNCQIRLLVPFGFALCGAGSYDCCRPFPLTCVPLLRLVIFALCFPLPKLHFYTLLINTSDHLWLYIILPASQPVAEQRVPQLCSSANPFTCVWQCHPFPLQLLLPHLSSPSKISGPFSLNSTIHPGFPVVVSCASCLLVSFAPFYYKRCWTGGPLPCLCVSPNQFSFPPIYWTTFFTVTLDLYFMKFKGLLFVIFCIGLSTALMLLTMPFMRIFIPCGFSRIICLSSLPPFIVFLAFLAGYFSFSLTVHASQTFPPVRALFYQYVPPWRVLTSSRYHHLHTDGYLIVVVSSNTYLDINTISHLYSELFNQMSHYNVSSSLRTCYSLDIRRSAGRCGSCL